MSLINLRKWGDLGISGHKSNYHWSLVSDFTHMKFPIIFCQLNSAHHIENGKQGQMEYSLLMTELLSLNYTSLRFGSSQTIALFLSRLFQW